MEYKDDWKELEKWQKNKELEQRLKYGATFDEIKPGKRKFIDRFTKFLKLSGISIWVFVIIVFSIVLLAVILFTISKFEFVKMQMR